MATIVGYETDSLDYTMVDGRPVPTGVDGSPANFEIIAIADATVWGEPQADGVREVGGMAALGAFNNNGTVFNVGTTDWPIGLTGPTSPVEIITNNVLRRLGARKTGVQRSTQEMYRYRAAAGGDSVLFTTSPFFAQRNSGWVYEAPAFRIHTDRVPGSAAVYQHHATGPGPTKIMFSLDRKAPAGWKTDGTAFYAFSKKSSTSQPVYQFGQPDGPGARRLRYSTTPTAPAGWKLDGVAFYAPTAPIIDY